MVEMQWLIAMVEQPLQSEFFWAQSATVLHSYLKSQHASKPH